MKLRAAVAVLLSIGIAALSACGKAANDGQTADTPSSPQASETASGQSTGVFSLLYCGNDTLNPYSAVTKSNQELGELLFDPLIKLDRSFQPSYVLAKEIKLNGKSCVIDLKRITFSDGSFLTAEDVTYSIGKAKASSTRYAAQLANVVSASAADIDTVSLTLKSPDPYFVNLLDFPVIKMNSDTRKDKDNRVLPPIGCGRYLFDDEAKKLTANSSYHGGALNIASISLVDTPDDEALQHNIEVGSVSMYFTDLGDNTLPKMTGKSLSVPMNHLVYLGVNAANTRLAVPEIRQAICAAIDRDSISDSAYYGHAGPAAGPFPSEWKNAEGMQTIAPTQNLTQAVANLEKVGYNNKDKDGYYVDARGKRLSFTLLCNVENSARVAAAALLSKQLAAAGIELKVSTVNWNAYQAAVTGGNFDLYLGEVKLPNNMDMTQLVTPGGAAAYGVTPPVTFSAASSSEPSSSSGASDSSGSSSSENTPEAPPPLTTAELLSRFYAGTATLSEVLAAFMSELPVIPLCHRSGQVVYSANLTTGPESTVSDLFFGIEQCVMK